ncbi:MAG: methyltransferase domain-containing protein [Methylococcaceae bacterium]
MKFVKSKKSSTQNNALNFAKLWGAFFGYLHNATSAGNLEDLITDKEAFKKYFVNFKYYAITEQSDHYQKNWLTARCSYDKTILDFACRNGENGIYAVLSCADCTGIDISSECVNNANKNAKEACVSSHYYFEVMDGEKMAFADNTFDLGVEHRRLHHVDIDAAMSELARVLKPNADMIRVEALRYNPFFHWLRKETPHLGTELEVEHILGLESLEVINKYFDKVEVKFFHLASLAAVPFERLSYSNRYYLT